MIPSRVIREAELQASIFAEIDLRANQDARWRFIFHCPNGGDRDARTATILKSHGVRAGVPDILWLLPACGYYGLAMELKVGKNKPFPAQCEWLQWLSDRNFYTCVVYDDPAQAMYILQQYLDGATP